MALKASLMTFDYARACHEHARLAISSEGDVRNRRGWPGQGPPPRSGEPHPAMASYQVKRDSETGMRSLHRTSIVESILIVLDDRRNGMERITAVGVLHGVLKIKVLNRDMIVAEF